MPGESRKQNDRARDAALRVVETLRGAGHVAYLAGGCVRDELLGIEPKDFDVATDARPEAVRGLFKRTAAVGASFGVVLVREGRVATEVATFRADGPYTDARRPDHVEFSSPEADAHRRDFTINALFMDPFEPDPSRRVIDFVGGRADIEARIVRAVGDPEQRLREDHLRALRAVRFACRYGFEIEAGTEAAVRAHAADLRGVSRERLGDEVRKMMAHPSRSRAAGMLAQLGLGSAMLGSAVSGSAGSSSAVSGPTGGVGALAGLPESGVDVATALAAWAVDRAGGLDAVEPAAVASEWRAALMLSNDETAALGGTLEAARAFAGAWDGLGVAGRKRLAAGVRAQAALLLVAAVEAERAREVRRGVGRLESDGIGLAPPPLVTGETLIAAGFAPGPGFGALLARVYDAQLEGKVGDAGAALALAREAAASCGVTRTEP